MGGLGVQTFGEVQVDLFTKAKSTHHRLWFFLAELESLLEQDALSILSSTYFICLTFSNAHISFHIVQLSPACSPIMSGNTLVSTIAFACGNWQTSLRADMLFRTDEEI